MSLLLFDQWKRQWSYYVYILCSCTNDQLKNELKKGKFCSIANVTFALRAFLHGSWVAIHNIFSVKFQSGYLSLGQMIGHWLCHSLIHWLFWPIKWWLPSQWSEFMIYLWVELALGSVLPFWGVNYCTSGTPPPIAQREREREYRPYCHTWALYLCGCTGIAIEGNTRTDTPQIIKQTGKVAALEEAVRSKKCLFLPAFFVLFAFELTSLYPRLVFYDNWLWKMSMSLDFDDTEFETDQTFASSGVTLIGVLIV